MAKIVEIYENSAVNDVPIDLDSDLEEIKESNENGDAESASKSHKATIEEKNADLLANCKELKVDLDRVNVHFGGQRLFEEKNNEFPKVNETEVVVIEDDSIELLNAEKAPKTAVTKPDTKFKRLLIIEADHDSSDEEVNKVDDETADLSDISEDAPQEKRPNRIFDSDDDESDVDSTSKKQNIISVDDLDNMSDSSSDDDDAPLVNKKKTKVFRVEDDEVDGESDGNEVILAHNPKVCVDPEMAGSLQNHQVEGIKFMFNCAFREKSGCILAHCMGLGKTFQVIALLHTAINYPHLKTNKILIICPKSTIKNWEDEFDCWTEDIEDSRLFKLFYFRDGLNVEEKIDLLKKWSRFSERNKKYAGCLLIGYEAFRSLVHYPDSKGADRYYSRGELEDIRADVRKHLLEPADIVICDEGHQIKNDDSATNKAITQIQTRRRIILTGTPMQNHLKEYYSMVNFVKPGFLGSKTLFNYCFAIPITEGQHKDSSPSCVAIMKSRSFTLHKKLEPFVQRREMDVLKDALPNKFEYVLFVPLTEKQIDLYRHVLNNTIREDGKYLLADYALLRKIWTHPKVLDTAYHEAVAEQKKKTKKMKQMLELPEDYNSEEEALYNVHPDLSKNLQRDWWTRYVTDEDLESVLPSNKLVLLFEILKECEKKQEKCLVFSSYVQVLNVVQFFLKQIDQQTRTKEKQPGLESFHGRWQRGSDYYYLDGSTPHELRHEMITAFNEPKNKTRMFLISARAGGQGINLIGANRVVLLDTSWNPSNDQQNFFRVYRLGQDKNCFIYRLLALGTMEERIYSRSVTKQAMSRRVVDKNQVDRIYNMAELAELYSLNYPIVADRPTPTIPEDDILAHLLDKFPELVFSYHIHDTLLVNKVDEELTEAEKQDAWKQYQEDAKRHGTIGDVQPMPEMMDSDDEAPVRISRKNMKKSGVLKLKTPQWLQPTTSKASSSKSDNVVDLSNLLAYSPEQTLTRSEDTQFVSSPKRPRLGIANPFPLSQTKSSSWMDGIKKPVNTSENKENEDAMNIDSD